MTFLALDAGNSSTKAALWDGTSWGPTVRVPAGEPLAEALTRFENVEAVGMATVVPEAPIREAVRAELGLDARAVSVDRALPFRLDYATPRTLGPDRLAAAAAAAALGPGRPVVVVDAGTAVTVDAVDFRDGRAVYRGGAIAPGADLLRRALARGTAALPEVSLPDRPPVIGDSTRGSIEAGVAGMLAGGVARLIASIAAELSASPRVVATGGWAPWLARHLPPGTIDRVEPTLVLDGIRQLVG